MHPTALCSYQSWSLCTVHAEGMASSAGATSSASGALRSSWDPASRFHQGCSGLPNRNWSPLQVCSAALLPAVPGRDLPEATHH